MGGGRMMIFAAALALAVGPALSQSADGAAGGDAPLAALRALADNPGAAKPASLGRIGFRDATFLVDGLSRSELTRLRDHMEALRLRLPSNIEGAIYAKTPRPVGNSGRR